MNPSTLETILRVAVGLATIATAVAALLRGPGTIRAHLKADAEILALLPKDSDSYQQLENHIAGQVQALAKFQQGRRNWSLFIFSIVATPVTRAFSYWSFQQQQWWGYLLAVPSGLLGLVLLYGIFESGQQVPRDASGKRIKDG